MRFCKYHFALSKEVAFVSEGVTKALQYKPSLEAESGGFFHATVQKVKWRVIRNCTWKEPISCSSLFSPALTILRCEILHSKHSNIVK